MTPKELKTCRILVTGGAGFLGSAVLETLHQRGVEQIWAPSSRELDLVDGAQIRSYLEQTRPELVVHLAARVGGIGANRLNPATFFYENLMMGSQLLHESWRAGVDKLVAVGTICAYPKDCPVPFVEDDIWNGYPEDTNAPYGIAKKVLSVQSAAYREQHAFNSCVIYPVNLYGPGDHFDLQSSHVIPAMLRKFHEAKKSSAPHVELWGDGSPTREFLYVEDCAEALVRCLEGYDSSSPLNLGSGDEISIRDLAWKIQRLVGYEGEVLWDTSKPSGQRRRRLDVSKAERELGFIARTSLDEGLSQTYRWYVKQHPSAS